MARTQFKVTFTNAQPGAPVEILLPSTDHVYPSAASIKPVGGKQLYLDASNSITVWSDAVEVIAQTVDGTGSFIQGTATSGSPTVTVSDGTAPANPPGSATYVPRRGGSRTSAAAPRFNLLDYCVADGTTDDTAAFQAVVNAAIAFNGSIDGPGTTASISVTDTITIQPASGAQTFLGLHFSGPSNTVVWNGANSKPVFKCLGLKEAPITGVNVNIPDGKTGVIAWDVDTSVAYPSTSDCTWGNCNVGLGNGTGNVGWRIGHVAGGIADISFMEWRNCKIIGGDASAAVSGQTGWLVEGNNALNLYIFGGGGFFLDKMVTNLSSAGATNAAGALSIWTYGTGGSHNNTDFENAACGTLTVSGGRFELGKRFLNCTDGGNHSAIKVEGIELDDYAPSDEIVFYVGRPSTLTVDTCRFTRASGAYTAAMFTVGGSPSRGSLIVRGGAMRAPDPFWTDLSASLWDITVSNVGILSDFFTVSRKMGERAAATSMVIDKGNATATVNIDASLGSYFKVTGTDTVNTFTIAAPTNPTLGQQLTIDITNARSAGSLTVTFTNGAGAFIKAGAFVSPAAGGWRRLYRFYYDGGAWIELTRSAADTG